MNRIRLHLPNSMHLLSKEVSQKDNVSLNQFSASAVAEKVSALTTETYLAQRAQQGSREKFLAVLDAVPNVPTEEFDRV